MERDIIKKRTIIDRIIDDCEKDMIRSSARCNHKVVDLYPIKEDTVIPEEALSPEKWIIPEGYYAIEPKNLD